MDQRRVDHYFYMLPRVMHKRVTLINRAIKKKHRIDKVVARRGVNNRRKKKLFFNCSV
ncbi:MAG: hypothetical protein O2779_00405 [Nanoarchaeota archaeon]|nr:hypothetical protein [Nanoarchaeota archaeon]